MSNIPTTTINSGQSDLPLVSSALGCFSGVEIPPARGSSSLADRLLSRASLLRRI